MSPFVVQERSGAASLAADDGISFWNAGDPQSHSKSPPSSTDSERPYRSAGGGPAEVGLVVGGVDKELVRGQHLRVVERAII